MCSGAVFFRLFKTQCGIAKGWYWPLWCCLLMACSTQAIAETLRVEVAASFINVHTGPASEYPIFHIAEKGEKIDVLKSHTGWYKVQLRKGQQGWISAGSLNQTIYADGTVVEVSSGSFEDFANRNWEVQIAAGLLEDVTSISASATWVVTSNIATQVTYGQALGDFAENKYWSIRLRHTTFPEWRLSPYLALGAGQLRTTPRSNLVASGDESRTNDIMEVGGGLRYYIGSNLLMNIEYKSVLALTQRDEQEEIEEWKLGITVFF